MSPSPRAFRSKATHGRSWVFSEEALQFTTDELEAREVEVAQLRVSAAEATEQVDSWRTQKDDIDRKIRHSSTALRNVLKDKETITADMQRTVRN